MNFIINGKNVDVTPGLKDTIELKLDRAQKGISLLKQEVLLSMRKNVRKSVTIPVKMSDKTRSAAISYRSDLAGKGI